MKEMNMNMNSQAILPRENINATSLTHEELARVEEIRKQIDIEDSQAIIAYGVGAQREVSAFADSILKEVRNRDSAYVGSILSDLVMKVNEVDVDSIGKDTFWTKVPLIGKMVSSVKRFITRYEKLGVQVERIANELDTARLQMLRDITLLDNLYSRNLEYMKSLELYIAAGSMKLEELRTVMLPVLRERAEETKAPADVQRYNDFQQAITRFEKKIHDLKLSRVISIQAAPQVRLIQNGDQALVEKIQSSILTTIPLWKNQMVIAITLLRQKKALELQKEITKTTNQLLGKNSEMFKDTTIGIAKESEEGIVEIETLKKVNSDLLATIQETLKVQAEGKAKRVQAESELLQIEKDLERKLMELKQELK